MLDLRHRHHRTNTSAFNRESFSPRVFLRGEKVAKPDEGAFRAIFQRSRSSSTYIGAKRPSSAYRHLDVRSVSSPPPRN